MWYINFILQRIYLNKVKSYLKIVDNYNFELCFSSLKVFESSWVWKLFTQYRSTFEKDYVYIIDICENLNARKDYKDIKILTDSILSLVSRYNLSPKSLPEVYCPVTSILEI